MALKAVRDAVEARLLSEWTEFPARIVNEDGGVPVGTDPWFRVTYPIANSAQNTFGAPGNNVWREEGAFRIQIGVEVGAGIGTALGWADDLAAIFRGKSFGGVTTWAPTSPVINSGNYQGGWYVVSFSVPYWYDLLG